MRVIVREAGGRNPLAGLGASRAFAEKTNTKFDAHHKEYFGYSQEVRVSACTASIANLGAELYL